MLSSKVERSMGKGASLGKETVWPTSGRSDEGPMADTNSLYAVRFPDGSVSLYIDEDYAIERGVDPAALTRVEIPQDMFVSGTIQEIREYVALYLESRHSGTV